MPNALFKPIMLNSEQISDYPIKSGQLIVSKDAYGIYLDIDDSTRKSVEQIIMTTETERTELLAPVTGFYYTSDSHKIYYYNGDWNVVGAENVTIEESEQNGYITVNGIDVKVFDASGYTPISHTTDYINPHKVSKSQIGLGKVENYSVNEILKQIDYDTIVDALGYAPPTSDTSYKAATSTTMGLVKSGNHINVGSDGTVTVVGGYATQLAKAVNIALSGAVSGTASFNGSSSINIATTLANVPASKIQGVLSIDNLPQGALERLVKVENKTARLALTTSQVQLGDTVQEIDTGLMYIVVNESKLNSEDGYVTYTAGSASSVPWSGVTGKPSTFTPSTHTHTLSQITDYKAYVHPAYTARTSGLYKITVDSTGHVSAVTNVTKSDITGLGIPGQDTVYTHPSHTAYNSGLYKLTVDSLGHVTAATAVTKNDITALGIPAQDTNTTYTTATATTLGLIKIGYTASGKNYPVVLDSEGKAYVSVPWTDTNTTYSAFKGASSSAAGSVGLVPAPASGQTTLYLKSDGTWGTPTNTTYSTATVTTAGIGKLYTATGTATDGSMTQKAITDALAGKAASSHTHTKAQITDFPTSMPASDVYAWAKAASKPTYTPTEVGVIGTAPTSGQVAVFDGTTGKIKSTGFTIAASVPSGAKFTDTTYGVFKGATSSAAGGAGLVPAPAKGNNGLFLRGDGTWASPANTTYGLATSSANGLLSSGDFTKLSKFTATEAGYLSGVTSSIQTQLNGKAASSHTHTLSQIADYKAYVHPSYTARSSGLYKVTVDATGHVSAVVAVTKADITALGIPGQDTNTTYTVFKAATSSAAGGTGLVPAPAAGKQAMYLRGDGTWATPTNTVYTHPTTSGNKHIPSGGSAGQILRWSADGTAAWGADNNTTYSTGTASVSGLTKLYTGTGTATDGTMTQAAINTALGGKANSSHTHTKSQITDFPASLKNPTAITIQFNGATNQTYDGSAAKTVNITPAAIGAAASSHSHAWSSVTSKPDIMNCMRMYGGTALDSKATTTDDKAQYKAIAISTATASTSAFSKVLTDLPKGKYSVMIRMKISAISSSGNIIKVQCGDTSALKTFYVKPNMFTSANTYQTFGFTVDHTTTSFTANLSIGTALASQTVTIDYIAIAPTFTAISSVA